MDPGQKQELDLAPYRALLVIVGAIVLGALAFLLNGCTAIEDTSDRLAAEIEPEDDPWCDAFALALESCDVDHYGRDELAAVVAGGCVDVAMAATKTTDGRTLLHAALLGAHGHADEQAFVQAVAACRG